MRRIRGALAWDGIHYFDCTDGESAADKLSRRADYLAIVQVLPFGEGAVLLHGLCSDRLTITRALLRHTCHLLRAAGYEEAYHERAGNHVMPLATLITQGPLRNRWRWDLPAIVAGGDGDY